MLVLSWIIKAAAKKNNPPKGSQPWDEARRRQAETPQPRGSFPNLQDLGKEIREVLLEVDGELLPEQTVSERKKAYRIKTVPEVKVPKHVPPEPQVSERVRYQENVNSMDPQDTSLYGELWLSPQAVVKGIIMSEILQPPRAKRPFRH